MVKTVLLECFIKVIEYGECSIRVYRSLSNILRQAFCQIFSAIYCGVISWSLLEACNIFTLIQLANLQHVYKINSDCSIRVNRSWTFEIPKSVAAMADTAATVPTPLG